MTTLSIVSSHVYLLPNVGICGLIAMAIYAGKLFGYSLSQVGC